MTHILWGKYWIGIWKLEKSEMKQNHGRNISEVRLQCRLKLVQQHLLLLWYWVDRHFSSKNPMTSWWRHNIFLVDWGRQRNWYQHMVCCLHHFSRLLDWFQWQLVSMFITMLNNNILIGWLLLEQWRFSLVELLVILVSSAYALAVIKVQSRSSNGKIELSVFSLKYHILYFVTWISCVVSCLHWNGNIWWQFAILHHFPTW